MVRKIKKQKIEEKIETEVVEKKEERAPFTFKSALGIFISCLVGSWIFPVILSLLGLKNNLAVVIGNTFVTSFGFVWTKNFIDTKKGYSKEFLKQYLIWAVIFGGISCFWLYRKF